MDYYPPAGTTFATTFGDFYDGFAARYNKHFCVGETGSVDGGTVEAKEAWVSQLANVDLNRFPCYKSTTWFEYLKAGHDYRIIVRGFEIRFCLIRPKSGALRHCLRS